MASPMDLSGLVLKGHRFLRLLGEGGMGRVYLAEDETLGRRVAVKVMSGRFAEDADAKARFLREARSMATVEHPHVVRVYSFGENEGAAYLVMEYVEGESLGENIRRLGKLQVDEALRIIRQVVEGLEAAWEKGIVHRDIKPSNILLDRRGRVHVADFGLAKRSSGGIDASLTASGSMMGTPHYVSPEQARGKDVDFRSDVYSLGIVLYEMITGEKPFGGTTPFEIVDKHLHEPLPLLAAKGLDLPPEAQSLVTSMTQKDPASRPSSYAALLRDLGAPETSDSLPTLTSGRGLPHGPRPRWARSLSIATALTLVGLGVFLWRRPAPASSPADAGRLVVAVTPFYGPDEASTKEGRVMAALVERAVHQRLAGEGVRVIGVEETKQPVRDHAAARALGDRLGANTVVWGEAFVLRGETEIQPYLTMVPRAGAESEDARPSVSQRDLASLERAAGSLVVGEQAANQIEMRKTGAQGVGDLVLVLAGIRALHAENKPEKALRLFSQAPPTPELLRYRAEALLRLHRPDDARKELEDATALDPKDPQTQGALGDLHLEAGRAAEALGAYRRASEAGLPYTTRRGALLDGLLYAKETYATPNKAEIVDSGYLLGSDPATGAVRERHRYQGTLRAIRAQRDRIELTCEEGNAEFRVIVSHGRVQGLVSLGSSLLLRRRGMDAGRALAANFLTGGMVVPKPGGDPGFRSRGSRLDVPNTLPDLEAALRAARRRDPTQPWHLFFLGQAEYSQGRRDQAMATWAEMFAGAYPAIPYYDYTWMSASFEGLGQPEWADRAFQEALVRRRRMPQPVGAIPIPLIERLINAPIMSVITTRWASSPPSALQLERGHLWMQRVRELGPSEGDDFAAAVWADYYDRRGETAKADAERAFLHWMQGATPSFVQDLARGDYALQTCLAATASFWATGLVLFLAARQRQASRDSRGLRASLAGLTREDRQALVAAAVLFLASLASLGVAMNALEATASLTIGITDAADSPSTIWQLEHRLSRNPTDAVRFVLAVCHHLAGHIERATELYEALPGNSRARKNLDALRAGDLVPPEPLRGEDQMAASDPGHGPGPFLLGGLPRWTEMMEGVGWLLLPAIVHAITAFVAVILIGVLLLLPAPAPGPAPKPLVPSGGKHFVDRLPGIRDLCRGSPRRGYVGLTSAMFAIVAVLAQVYGTWKTGSGGTGFLGTDLPGMLKAFPLPPVPFWPIFWAYADAPHFWFAVCIAAATAVGLHLAGGRGSTAAQEGEASRPTRAEAPQEDPFVSS